MGHNQGDRRVKRTKRQLEKSLIKLLEDKPITKVTVKELCELADINRSTFYQYYDNPPAMLNQMRNELFERLIAHLRQYDTMSTFDVLLTIVREMSLHKHYYKIFYGDNGSKELLNRLISTAYDNEIHKWKKQYVSMDEVEIRYVFTFLIKGADGIIEQWIVNGFIEPPDHIAHLIAILCKRVVGAYCLS